jgi:CheY-like chemotaxis protein
MAMILLPSTIYGGNLPDAMAILKIVDKFYPNVLASRPEPVFFCSALDMSQTKSSGGDSPATIFVVDDEPMLLDLASAILQPLGYEVRTFRDPQVALKEFLAARPELIVTDYAMGAMNGMDLVRECKRVNPRQKIILLSGTVDENIYANEQAKPDRFIAKPYQVREFIESVQKLAAS